MPSTYRFLNADHSLVLRDDHVIAWDSATNRPAGQQPPQDGPPSDEIGLWTAAGSPVPDEVPTPRQQQGRADTDVFSINRIYTDFPQRPISELDPEPAIHVPPIEGARIAPAPLSGEQLFQLRSISNTVRKLKDNDVAGLKEQLAKLTEALLMPRPDKEPKA